MNIRALFCGIAVAGVASLLATPSFAIIGDGVGGCLDNSRSFPGAAGTVCANVQVRMDDAPMVSSPLPDVAAGPVSASGGGGGSGSGALAASSADFGEVHLSGSAFIGVTPNSAIAEGWAFASFTDELTVTQTVSATFTDSADGVFINDGHGSFELRVYDLATGQQPIYFIYDALYPINPSYTFTQDGVLLQAGHTYVVFAAYEALAGEAAYYVNTAYQSDADMSNTGQLFIDAPGGSFTTLSGHDYSTDAGQGGVSGVPEPSTWAMLLIGFTGLGFAARHRMARAGKPLNPGIRRQSPPPSSVYPTSARKSSATFPS